MHNGLERTESTDSVSSWRNQPSKYQSKKKTTQDLINELTAEIGSTYASLRQDRGKQQTQPAILKNYESLSQTGFMTAKKKASESYRNDVIHTEPSNKQGLPNFQLNTQQEEKASSNYFTRAHPISPPGSSYDALLNARQGLTRTYSSTSVSKTDLPRSFLERIANKIYDHPSDSKGKGFDKYKRECKEDLVLARQAAEALNAKHVQNGSLRLHRDYDSNFLPDLRAEDLDLGPGRNAHPCGGLPEEQKVRCSRGDEECSQPADGCNTSL